MKDGNNELKAAVKLCWAERNYIHEPNESFNLLLVFKNKNKSDYCTFRFVLFEG